MCYFGRVKKKKVDRQEENIMKKKILSLLLVAGLSVSLFAGCGSGAALLEVGSYG